MDPATLIRLRPTTPWRVGPNSGARESVDSIYHSDSLYSALSGAMLQLGWLEEWLGATALRPEGPAVRFSSCFPFQDTTLFVTPPRNLWPPTPSPKTRWKGARFIPLPVIETLLVDPNSLGKEEEHWIVDPASECLLAIGRGRAYGPFRTSVRSSASLDRITGVAEPHVTGCLEFSPGSGLWCVAVYAGEEARDQWADKIKAALRLLADSGFGGERSRGWGRSQMPQFHDGTFPELLLKTPEPPVPAEGEAQPPAEIGYWLLSLFNPSSEDAIDWKRGNYALVTRGGRIESAARWGDAKLDLRMVSEGSVVFAPASPKGGAPNVAPEGFPHPVYRAGFALSIPIPWRVVA